MFRKYVTLLFLSFVWGTTWIAIKYSLMGIPPFLGAAARFAVAALCLYLYARWRHISLRLSRADFQMIFITAVLLYLFNYGAIYWGEQYLNAGATAVFFAAFPLFTSVMSNFVLRSEAFQWRKFIGMLIGFAGIAIVFYDQLLQTAFEGMVIWATLAVLFSALSAALSLVMVKKYLSHLETVSLTLHQMLWGILLLGLAGELLGEAAAVRFDWRALGAVIYMGVIASALAFVLYYWLLKEMSAVTLSGIIYITPLVALFIGWLLLDEPLTLRILAGTLVTFAGIAIAQSADYRKLWKRRLTPLP